MSIEELNEYFKTHNLSTYEREGFDVFLEKMNFSFPLKAIHITGTNGKGSTANFIYNIYRENGYKVGLFNSPYFTSATEMIKVNGNDISDDELINLFLEFKDKFEEYHLTSFEMQTYLAYTYFARLNLDIAIIEVGMGGAIDATNIITPILSIITNVSLEHTAYLGRSVSEIAYNKAGIIKEEIPVLVGKLDESAMYAIKEYAKDMSAPIHVVDDYHNERVENGKVFFDCYPLKNICLNSNALYQCQNASLAIGAVELIKDVLPFDEDKIKDGLSLPLLNGRFEYLDSNLLIDGAHNPDGMKNLVESLKSSETRPIHVIFACFRDKNIENMLITLGDISNDVTLTTFNHKRARTEEDYFLYLGDYQFEQDYMKLIKDKINEYPNDLVLVTGSLAFVGLVREEYKNEK